jgi:hypothetical protein
MVRPRMTENQYSVFSRLKEKKEQYVLLPCSHVPFHNQLYFHKIKNLISDIKPKEIVLQGDFIDCNALGSYEKGKISSTGIDLDEEYDEANKELNELEQAAGHSDFVYLFGNHENRYFRWKSDVNNAKYGDLVNPVRAMQLDERGYKVFQDYLNDFYSIGSLQVIHGEFFNIHAAKRHLDVFRRNIIFAHTHRVQYYREGDFGSWNIGFLGNKNAPCFNYASRSMKDRWANAFAVVTVDGNFFHVDMIEFINDSFYYGGIKY